MPLTDGPPTRKYSKKSTTPPFVLAGTEVPAGTRTQVRLQAGTNMAFEGINITVEVIHGKRPGPCLLVTGGIHGDEINGTEIIRRLVDSASLNRLRGTILAVPVVNFPAFAARTRYLPDRRDLNRLFPGSEKGSLGARLANAITTHLIPACDAVIDLHTGAINRPNLPQLRITSDDAESLALGEVFGAPVTMFSSVREGSFRGIAHAMGKPFVLYEAGEALRLDAPSIRFGLQGILSVMREMKMLPSAKGKKKSTIFAKKSTWERAPVGGLFTSLVPLGKATTKGMLLGFVVPPFSGGEEHPVLASRKGVVIGRTNEGLADEGDALFHIAVLSDSSEIEDHLQQVHDELPGSLQDDDDDHPVPYHAFPANS